MSSSRFNIDLRTKTLKPLIEEALLLGYDPHHYHPLYIRIYEMTYLKGKYGKFLFLTNNEKQLWISCFEMIEAEKKRFQLENATTVNQTVSNNLIEDEIHNSKQHYVEKYNELQVEPVCEALRNLVMDIRGKTFHTSPNAVMMENIHAKKYFLAHSALVTTAQDYEKMKCYWERLCEQLTSNDGLRSVTELQDIDKDKGKCFICNAHVENLKRHIRNMHSLSMKQCQECKRKFSSSGALYSHRRDYHKRFILKHKLTDRIRNHYDQKVKRRN